MLIFYFQKLQALKTEKDNNLLTINDDKIIWNWQYFLKFKCRERIHTIGLTVLKTIETHHYGTASGNIAKTKL
jgi:hypothetical protein